MRRYPLRTELLTALPFTRPATAADLVEAARRLKALDTSDAATKDVARIRSHAVQFAIPAWWRERNTATSPPWPPHNLIETWIALGASRALDLKPPEANVPAYAAGYVTVTAAYRQGTQMDKEAVVEISPPDGGIDPRLASAWVQAAADVATLSRDGEGQNGAYSSADNVSATAKDALAKNGLTWARVGVTFEPCALAQCEVGNQKYVGDTVERWMLVHESGAVLTGTTRAAVIASKGRPHDKAAGATLTYNSGHTLRGLLNMEREGKHSTERRNDGGNEPPFVACSPDSAKAISLLCTKIASLANVTREQVFRGAWEQLGYPYNVDADSPAKLTPDEAIAMHRWLDNDLKTSFPNDDDQSQGTDRGAP